MITLVLAHPSRVVIVFSQQESQLLQGLVGIVREIMEMKKITLSDTSCMMSCGGAVFMH